MIAVKPVSIALALCWHAGSRLTRLGTGLMRVAAEHGHVPTITDEDAARMSPETDDEAKARMRGDVQDWTSGQREHHGRPTISDLWKEAERGGPIPQLPVEWLADQQANPTWKPAAEVTQEMLDLWPVWEWREPRYGAMTPTVVANPTYDDPELIGQDQTWRPLILPGMDLGLRDGVICATQMTGAHWCRVAHWQCASLRSGDEWRMVADGNDDIYFRPAIWAELDAD